MTTVALSAVSRSDFGKGAARRIRRDGNIPAVIYGDKQAPVMIAVEPSPSRRTCSTARCASRAWCSR